MSILFIIATVLAAVFGLISLAWLHRAVREKEAAIDADEMPPEETLKMLGCVSFLFVAFGSFALALLIVMLVN